MPQVVLVIGVGRSGSTLMQRVINTMPSTNVCGENNNAWLHVARFAASWLKLKISDRSEYEQRQERGDHFWLAWYNVGREPALISSLQTLFFSLYGGDRWRRIGFKEIRFGDQGYAIMQAQLDFFRWLFPDCKIIFNLREAKAIQQSQDRQRDPSAYGEVASQRLFERYAKENGDCLIWHYEDWQDPKQVQRIYAYLGEPFSENYRKALDRQTR